jgi:hypothetical protein
MNSKRPVPHAVAGTLVGMFLLLDSVDHEHYRTGKIVAASGDCFLIQFDWLKERADRPPPPMELITIEELNAVCEHCGQKVANLFESRADLERWVTWLETPEKPTGETDKVVGLRKPH